MPPLPDGSENSYVVVPELGGTCVQAPFPSCTASQIGAKALQNVIEKLPPAALTANALLVAPVRPVADPVSVYPVPAGFRLKFEKVATPFTAATVLVPVRVPLAGLVPIATVMLVVAVVTVLPCASWIATCTAGVITAPATAVLGDPMKASFAAAPPPGGCTGPSLLPEHPVIATPQSTTPAKNRPRTRAIGRPYVTGDNRGNQSSARNANGLSLPLERWRRYGPK